MTVSKPGHTQKPLHSYWQECDVPDLHIYCKHQEAGWNVGGGRRIEYSEGHLESYCDAFSKTVG